MRVSHVWAQNPEQTRWLQAACNILHASEEWHDLEEAIDAMVLVRDDPERDAEMTFPLPETGLPVFIDKPMSPYLEELGRFWTYFEEGQLML